MTRIWFAWSCALSQAVVEPLHRAAFHAGYEAELAPRGGYDDLAERMSRYTHFVYGVGPDASWNTARELDVVGINIMHGQYVFDTWFAPVPHHAILTGKAYCEDARRTLNKPVQLHAPGYIRADALHKYTSAPVKPIRCLVALPKIEEHRWLDTWSVIDAIGDQPGIVFRVHPRNRQARRQLLERGYAVDNAVGFYESLARSQCLLSGPSNCIIEACILGIPVGLLALSNPQWTADPSNRDFAKQLGYHHKLCRTYHDIATTFRSVNELLHWIERPVAKPPEAAARYWANTNGDIQPVIDCFLRILQRTPA